jgi:hypothetical protein
MPTAQVAIIAVAAVLITLIWACVKLGKTTSSASDGCGPECSEMHTETGRCEIAQHRVKDATGAAAPRCIASHCVEGDHIYDLGPAEALPDGIEGSALVRWLVDHPDVNTTTKEPS